MKPPTDDVASWNRAQAYARDVLNADLVGVAPVARFAHAPLMMSPQGLWPEAKSVLVMAVHHPDACIEMGGRLHPQIIGPYRIQYAMNNRLDDMSFRMAVFLEREGFRAMPITASNIWRYKGYKQLNEHFAPDMSHMHAAVAAGLAEFGINGLAITPQFGARQRYISVLTDAVFPPTPLQEPGSVCDRCQLCVRHCPTNAFRLETDGENVVKIEDRTYTYIRKNLWRCSWGEHFDLDLDLPIPAQVDEQVILENVRQHGHRSGEMGSCLRYCLPKALRYFDRDYTNAPRRRRAAASAPTPAKRAALRAIAEGWGCDLFAVSGSERLAAMGLTVTKELPDGVCAITVGIRLRRGTEVLHFTRNHLLLQAAYDITRALEREGHSAVCTTDIPESSFQKDLAAELAADESLYTETVITSAAFATELPGPRPSAAISPRAPAALRADLEREAKALGIDVFGVAPADRLAALAPQVAAHFDGQPYFDAEDKAANFSTYDPVVTAQTTRVRPAEERLPGVRSAIVLGVRIPRVSAERTALPPAEAVGPYAFAQYQSVRLAQHAALRLIHRLHALGYQAVFTGDLFDTGSLVGNPRGQQPDIFANRFAAWAAGLGRLSRAGFLVAPEFGPHLRTVTVLTDAPLTPDGMLRDDSLTTACTGCNRCIQSCATQAFADEFELTLEGVTDRLTRIRRDRCDWAKRYSLIGEEGVNFTGWDLHVEPPQTIDAGALAAGLRQQPPIPKYRPCNFEACVMTCPIARPQRE